MSAQVVDSRLMVLLFSDLVGSSAPRSTPGCWARHDAIFRAALGAMPGARVLQDLGDGYLISFPTPSHAVRAALLAQWAIVPGASGPSAPSDADRHPLRRDGARRSVHVRGRRNAQAVSQGG